MKKITPISLGIMMLAGAIGHIASPEFYIPMIPHFLPDVLANYLSAILEALVGILLFIPQYRKWGGLGFMLLMLGFLPIHIWDLFRIEPAIGPHPAPAIRLVFQFVLIFVGYWVYRAYREK